MAKRAVCISCFDFYEDRVELVMEHLRSRGYECTYITGDYSHFTREKYTIDIPGGEQVPTLPYRKNMSVARLLSHRLFAFHAFRRVRQLKPDILYVMVPPNSLSLRAASYKKRHPGTRVLLDLYDLWPETFPDSMIKKLAALPFAVWQWERDRGIRKADLIYSECNLYREVLKKQLAGKQVRTLPICREHITAHQPLKAPEDGALNLCYLGSIGSLLDFDVLMGLMKEILPLRPVNLRIIGDGETRERLVAEAKALGVHVAYYGKIYDAEGRQKIFDQCHLGVNIMKKDVCVGLTMKSMDYFAGGLPVLNTIEGDTRELVARYNAGIEVDRSDLAATARRVAAMTGEENVALRRNTLRMFEDHFSSDHVRAVLKELE